MAGDLPEYALWPHPVDAVGGFFAHGTAGGAAFYFVRGLIRGGSPGSRSGRLLSGVRAALANAPRVGGRLAAWCAMIYSIEYAAYRVRDLEYRAFHPLRKGAEESLLVPVAGGVAFFGLLGMRRGGLPMAARYVLRYATGMVVMAECGRCDRLEGGERCLRRNQMNGGQRPAPVVLRPPNQRPLLFRMLSSSSSTTHNDHHDVKLFSALQDSQFRDIKQKCNWTH